MGITEQNISQMISSVAPQSGEAQYPVMPKQPEPGKGKQPDFHAYGTDGVTIFSGIIDYFSTGEYNADFDWLNAVLVYDTMVRNDGQIQALLSLVEFVIKRAHWTIKPGSDQPRDKEIAAFVDECLFKGMSWTSRAGRTMYRTWPQILHHILMMIAYGFAPFEIVYKKEDGWIKWADWKPLLPRTLYRWWVDAGNDLTGIQIWTWKDYLKQYINIPADKLLLFVNDQEGSNYTGRSMLRGCYKHWYYKDRFYAIEAIAIERAAVAPPVFHLSQNPTEEEQTLAKSIVKNVRVNEDMGITVPFGTDIEVLKGSQRQAAPVQPSIQHHDMMMARAFLAQFINLGSNETGSYALAQQQIQMFLAAFQSKITDIIAVINREICRLVDWNYDNVEAYPELTASKLVAQDITTLTAAWKDLNSGNAPVLTPSPEIEEWFLDELGLPKSVTHSIANTNPSAPSTPERPQNGTPQDHGNQNPKIEQQPNQADPEPPSTSAGQLSEALTEARLLREAMTTLDAVEKGYQFFNPRHIPAGNGRSSGEFAPRGGGAGGGGSEHASRGSGRHAIEGVTHVSRSSGGSGGGGGHPSGTPEEREAHWNRVMEAARAKSARSHDIAREEKVTTTATGRTVVRPRSLTREELTHWIDANHSEQVQSDHVLDPEKVWSYAHGDPHMIHALLSTEATGNLETMARTHGIKVTSNAKERIAQQITEHLDRTHNGEQAQFGNNRSAKEEDIHAKAARLQKEQGLRAETQFTPNEDGIQNLTPIAEAGTVKVDAGATGLSADYVRNLVKLYGEHQLGVALSGYSMTSLREAASGLGVKSVTSKAALISAITSHVTEGRYSADFRSSKGEATSTRSKSAKSGDTISRAEHERAMTKMRSDIERQHAAELKKRDDAMAKMQKQIDALKGAKSATKVPSEPKAAKEETERSLRNQASRLRVQASTEEQTGGDLKLAASRRQQADELDRRADVLKSAKAQSTPRTRGSSKAKGFKSPSEDLNKLTRQQKVSNLEFNPYKAMSPHLLLRQVGREQFHAALSALPHAALRQMAKGSGIKTRASKDAQIAEIEKAIDEGGKQP